MAEGRKEGTVGCLSPYAPATRSPVLTYCMLRPGLVFVAPTGARYPLNAAYAFPVPASAIGLRACCGISGTDVALMVPPGPALVPLPHPPSECIWERDRVVSVVVVVAEAVAEAVAQ
eukprot:3526493-Rhodomonas_salina.2